jgi:class 3 adenylate cyclase
MTFKEDLTHRVNEIAADLWLDVIEARVPPEPADPDLTFGNTGKRIDACVMYADLHRSTEMVDSLLDERAAEYYKAFLHCAGKLITRNGGSIQAYDGDRIMGIFVGHTKADLAVTAAFELNDAVHSIINPAFAWHYGAEHRPLQHTVGIDTGQLLVAKIGVRRDSDLVWVGPAANYAAKLNSFEGLDIDYPTRITDDVRSQLSAPLLLYGTDPIWEGPYNNMKVRPHWRSHYRRIFN